MTGIWLFEHPFFVWKTRALSIALPIHVGKLWELRTFRRFCSMINHAGGLSLLCPKARLFRNPTSLPQLKCSIKPDSLPCVTALVVHCDLISAGFNRLPGRTAEMFLQLLFVSRAGHELT
jgi:hypothetical protein